MKTVGVIAEYNPFHNGHAYHLKKAKELSGADFVIAVMSGNFVQRGIPAIMDKFTRAHMALLNGADLVLELPCAYACASAELFAYGGVSILNGLGADALCFGVETDNLPLMRSICDILLEEPEPYKILLQKELSRGNSFPSARKAALLSCLPAKKEEAGALLDSPNNILGLEYLKALKRLNSGMIPILLKRRGAGYHDEKLPLASPYPSASSLRRYYQKCESLSGFRNLTPENLTKLYEAAQKKTFPVYPDDFSDFLYYKLLSASPEDLFAYADVSQELCGRILNLRRQFINFSSFAQELKTRQYTLTRVYRALLHILLNIKKEKSYPLYAHILGFHKSATCLLNQTASSIPIVTKAADHKELLLHDSYCADLYNHVLLKKFGFPMKDDFTHPLVII